MARLGNARLATSRRMPLPQTPVRRDPGLLLAVALIIVVAPIGWINAVSQLLLPTGLPPHTAPPTSSESRRGGATFDIAANGSTATPPTIPTATRASLVFPSPVRSESEATFTPGLASETASSPTPFAASEVATPAPSPTALDGPTSVPTPAPAETATAVPTISTPETIAPAPTVAPTRRAPESATMAPSSAAAPQAAPQTSAPAGSGTTYVVQAGDTLWSIASRYGVDVAQLRIANRIGEDNAIRVGQSLLISRVDGVGDRTVAPDLLNEVAHQYGVEPATVAQASGRLSTAAPIRGQAAVIPGEAAPPAARVATPAAAVSQNPTTSSTQLELRSASRRPNTSARLQWPALGGISTFFGEDGHSGLDIMGYTGQPVTAAASGVVTAVNQSDEAYGWRIDVDHGSGIMTLYAHLSEFNVKLGDQVSAGQRIGSVGNTGLSTGPHLHFEVRASGLTVDPLDYLR